MSAVDRVVSISILVDRNATVAEADYFDNYDDLSLVATGSSKREQGDVFDREVALDLAIGRALEKLGRQLRHRGKARVRLLSETAEKRCK